MTTAVQLGLRHHLKTRHQPGRNGDDYVCPDCDFVALADGSAGGPEAGHAT